MSAPPPAVDPAQQERIRAVQAIPVIPMSKEVKKIIGNNEVKGLVFAAIVERETTSRLNPRKKVLLIATQMSVFFCEVGNGHVYRIFRGGEIISPLTVATGSKPSMVLRVKGEHDAMIHFGVKHPANDGNGSGEEQLLRFSEMVKVIHDAQSPGEPLNVDRSDAKTPSELKKTVSLLKSPELKRNPTAARLKNLEEKKEAAVAELQRRRSEAALLAQAKAEQEEAERKEQEEAAARKEAEEQAAAQQQAVQEPAGSQKLDVPPINIETQSLEPHSMEHHPSDETTHLVAEENPRSRSHSAAYSESVMVPQQPSDPVLEVPSESVLKPDTTDNAAPTAAAATASTEPQLDFDLGDIPRVQSMNESVRKDRNGSTFSGSADVMLPPAEAQSAYQQPTHTQPLPHPVHAVEPSLSPTPDVTPQQTPEAAPQRPTVPMESVAVQAASVPGARWVTPEELEGLKATIRETEVAPLLSEKASLNERLTAMQTYVDKSAQMESRQQATAFGEYSADDFNKLVQQLLQVQRQLNMERIDRKALIESEVANVRQSYDGILLHQQDEISMLRAKVREFETVFVRMQNGIDAGGSEAAFAVTSFPSSTASASSHVVADMAASRGTTDPAESRAILPSFLSGAASSPRLNVENQRELKRSLMLDL